MWRVLANEPANHYITGIDAPRRRRIVILSKTKTTATSLPSKADILAFIGKQPGKVGTREIARAFGLKNALRAELKRLLRDLADEGAVETPPQEAASPGRPALDRARRRRRARSPTATSSPRPTNGTKRRTARRPRSASTCRATPRRGEAAGLGDRVLLRVDETDEDAGIRHRGRVIRIIDKPKHRVLGIFRVAPRGGGRLEPVDKKMLGKELLIPRRRDRRRAGRRPRRGRDLARRALRPANRPRRREARLAQERARGQPDRHPRPRHPARLPARDHGRGARRRRPATMAHREDWRDVPFVTIDPPDAKDHDDAVHAEPDPTDGGFIVNVAIADVAHYVRARLGARPRGARCAATRSISPTASCRCCRSASPTTSARCARRRTAPALAVRMIIGADGRKRSHTLPPHHDALGGASSPTCRRRRRSPAAPTRSPDRCSNRAEAALRRLRDAGEGAQRARAARSRSARAQDPARRPTAPSTASSCRSGSRRTG